MSLETSVLAIRDYVMNAVDTAWAGVPFTEEFAEIIDPPPIARVRLDTVNPTPTGPGASVGIESAPLRFEIYGRFAKVANLSEAITEKTTDLRLALLASVNPGASGEGFEPRVTDLDRTQLEITDQYYECGVVFECYVLAPRS